MDWAIHLACSPGKRIQLAEKAVRKIARLANYTGRRWNLSFTAGGSTYPEAQAAAMSRCNSDQRTSGRCQLRTAVCADGR